MSEFVGFSSTTDWLAAIDTYMPVNADVVTMQDPSSHAGLTHATTYMILSQHQGGEDFSEILYCQVMVDRFEMVNGEPLEAPAEAGRHEQRSTSAQVVMVAWLEQHQLKFRRAVLAAPKDLRMLEGNADFLRYDKEHGVYVLRAPEVSP